MTLSQIELALLIGSVNTIKDGSPRKFQFVDLAMISPLAERIGALVEEGQLKQPSYELELSTEEKMKVKGYVEEHEWQSGDAKHVLSLVEKLK